MTAGYDFEEKVRSLRSAHREARRLKVAHGREYARGNQIGARYLSGRLRRLCDYVSRQQFRDDQLPADWWLSRSDNAV